MAFIELKQQWSVTTSKGPAKVVAVIDYGPETNLVLVCVLERGGEIWCPQSPFVRFRENWTMGRTVEPKKRRVTPRRPRAIGDCRRTPGAIL